MYISLHRVIAEIKNLEQKLMVNGQQVVGVATKKDGMVGHTPKEKFEQNSQGCIDSFVDNLERLRNLKVARNIANATTKVCVSGQEMTIDEAIVRKATASYLQQFIQGIKQQYVGAVNTVNAASQEVERKIEAQVIAIGGSSKKVSEEEMKTIRAMMERSTGKEIVVGKNVEAFLEKSMAEIEKFMVEVDFVLSEANAMTQVDV